ncbi:MAG: tetratricopeptide repeat protein, partial [Chthoniobacterales bacterium]
HEKFNDAGLGGLAGTLDGYSFPRAWLEAQVARAKGDKESAQRAFAQTLKDVENDIGCCPDDAKAVMMLAFLYAALGNKDEAIKQAEKAVAMLAIELDAYDGPMLATNLAAIYAQFGEKDRALDLLGKLRRIPMAATSATLRIEHEWDSLRGTSRFAQLAEG